MSKKNKDNNNLSFQIITLGNPGVGKTSIIHRYISNVFDNNNLSTIGIDFCKKEITLKNGKKIQLKLTDTGGQELYKSLSKTYFKNSDGVLFVFSLNNEESFRDISKWIKDFKENCFG